MGKSRGEIEESLALADAVALEFSRKSLGYFLDQIVIPAQPEPMRFGDCADDWQREMLGPLVPAIDHLAGLNEGYSGPLRFMQILARGHNKSSLEAWIASFLLICSKRPIKGYVLAADADQGQLILEAMEDLFSLNPWVAKHLSITKRVITGPAGFIKVLARDASSSMGLRGNFYIADEFVHWERQKEWTALVTGLRKIRPTVFVAISNAGLIDSWQHKAFVRACAKPNTWTVFHKPGTLASWLDAAGVEEDKSLVPPSEAKRLFDNEWIDPAEEHDYLRRPEIQACADLGEAMGLMYRVRRELGVDNYVACIDYGPKRDRTALAVLHEGRHRQVIVDRLDIWEGKNYPGGKVLVKDIEDWVRTIRERFSPKVFVVDPYQMEGTIQWMEREGIKVEPFKFRAGAGNYELAQHLRAAIVTKRLVWYPLCGQTPGETLEDELAGLRVKKMPYGFRFDHENQRHDDRAFVLAAGSLAAVNYPLESPCMPTQAHLLVRRE